MRGSLISGNSVGDVHTEWKSPYIDDRDFFFGSGGGGVPARIGFVDNSDSVRQRPRLWISWHVLGNAAELVCESSPSISSTAMSHASVTSPGSWPSFPERTLAGGKVHMTD